MRTESDELKRTYLVFQVEHRETENQDFLVLKGNNPPAVH